MARERANKGVIVGGHGRIEAEVLAVGDRARAIKNVAAADESLASRGLDELRARLDELARAVEAHAASLPNAECDDVVTATAGIAAQLAEPRPNRFVLTTLLDGLAAKARMVTNLAVAVDALRGAVGNFL